jgi:hypothetical protein
MLWKRRIDGDTTVKDHLEREGTVDIEGEVSVGDLAYLADVMGIGIHAINVSCGPGEKLRIHVPKP